MSRPGSTSMHFVCRQCRHALKKTSQSGRRHFSSTPARDGRALPVFQPTSSPELDTLLTTIRSKYFLPQYLNSAQRKLIRSTKLRSQLENDPIFATLGAEEVRLEHLDVTKDIPSKSAFLEVIGLLSGGETKDWQNLPGLLEGYHRSKVQLAPQWLSLAIKKAREAGALSTIVQCLQQVEKNGFSLSIPEVREGVLLGLRSEAKESGWVHGAKRLQSVEAVLSCMEHPDHCGSRKVTDNDPRAEPFVIAVPLELAAQDVLVNGKEGTDKVETYSTRLITALAQQKSELNETAPWQIPTGLTRRFEIKQAQQTLERTVAKFVPVHNALKLAQQVRGQSWPEDERAFATHLQKQIEQKLDAAVAEAGKIAEADLLVEIPAVEEWKATARS